MRELLSLWLAWGVGISLAGNPGITVAQAVNPQGARPIPVTGLKPLTTVGDKHTARTPCFTLVGDRTHQHLLLWWHYTELQGDSSSSLLLGNAQYVASQFITPGSVSRNTRGLAVAAEIIFTGLDPRDRATLRFTAVPDELAVATCLQYPEDRRQARNAAIIMLQGKLTPTNQLQFDSSLNNPDFWSPKALYSNLPYTIDGFPDPDKQPLRDGSRGEQTDTPPAYYAGYMRPSLVIPTADAPWFMVGGYEDDLWFTRSFDKGKTWTPDQTLSGGDQPNLIVTALAHLLLFSIKPTTFRGRPEWPDDNGYDRQDVRQWPALGQLMLRRSLDNGQVWSDPQAVLDDRLVIQCRACVDLTGRIWLVYVQSDPDKGLQGKASLWLTSSSDEGKTWAPAARLTDGRYLDREPDNTYYNGKLLIAFSRGGRALNTNIWVAEIDPQAALSTRPQH